MRFNFFLSFLFVFLSIISAKVKSEEADSLTIISTIRPLGLIVREILGSDGDVLILGDSQKNAHDFVLLPSHRIALAHADLLVWVGPELEVQLKGVASMFVSGELVTVSKIPNIVLWPLSNGEKTLKTVDDMHLWLGFENAIIIAKSILDALNEKDPERAEVYLENFQNFNENLTAMMAEINLLFDLHSKSNSLMPYAVGHNAYQYFERQMGIKHSLVLLRDPERSPSIREIFETRRNVKKTRPQCLFVSPDMDQSILKSTLNGYQIVKVEIDILGRDIEVVPGGYLKFVEQVADGFSSCLMPI
jgi:zinc transport system substrate-binding protein